MKSPPKQDTAQLLPPSRITGIVHSIPVLVQEESALVHRQLIEDKLRVKRILALGGLSTHGVIVTRREGHGRRHAGLSHRRACYGNPARRSQRRAWPAARPVPPGRDPAQRTTRSRVRARGGSRAARRSSAPPGDVLAVLLLAFAGRL